MLPRMVSAMTPHRQATGASCGGVPSCGGSRVTGEQLALAGHSPRQLQRRCLGDCP